MELAAENIEKSFGSKIVLRGLTLNVRDGEIYLLVGPNGSGKTTLMSILASAMRPDSGHVRLDDLEVKRDRIGYRKQVGFLSHNSMLYSRLTARENLFFVGNLYGLKGLRNRVDLLLEEVGLEHDGDELVGNFSRGMLQRLSIARALIHNPRVLLLDEPYSGLDLAAASTLTGMLKGFSLHKRIVVLSSHSFEMCADVATRGGVLYDHSISYETDARPGGDFRARYLSLLGGQTERET
jgi:heme exporter protein A